MIKISILPTLLNVIRKATFAVAILIPASVFAFDEDPDKLPSSLYAVENLGSIAHELKISLTSQAGFPAEYVKKWASAVDEAFAPGLLKADFERSMNARLTEDARSAALAFDASSLGQETLKIVTDLQPRSNHPDALAKARQRVASASAEENALFVDLFEAQRGARRANEVLDFYFQAMETAAAPAIGADAAKRWTASAKHLREAYVEEYFLTSTMIYDQLPLEKRKKLAAALSSPPMLAYAEQSTSAFSETLKEAASRLENAYARKLKDE